jgi:hypothetical protein
MSKIAYLVLAHANCQHFKHLIQRLDSPNAHFFVHIDKKSEQAKFAMPKQKRLHFAQNRFSIHWGEFTIVSAALELMKLALNSKEQFDYLVLLSGVDYPLRSSRYIEHFFSEKRGEEFIAFYSMDGGYGSKPLYRLTRYVPRSDQIDDPKRLRQLRNEGISAGRDYQQGLGGLKPFCGSAWWALTAEACRYILEFVECEKEIVEFFHHTLIPDEMFFQTILGNSPFKDRLSRCPSYNDWSAGGAHPAQITSEHLSLFASEAFARRELLFARKFSDESEVLLSKIDEIADKQDLVDLPTRSSLKLLVLIGCDYHLPHLPHFLAHYTALGVDRFFCGLQGHEQTQAQAREILADYPHEIIANYEDRPFERAIKNDLWGIFRGIQSEKLATDEWCLYADVDEFHEYPADFFATLDPSVNALRGRWIERLADEKGRLQPLLLDRNIGEQFPWGTEQIFCAIPQKVIALRGGLTISQDHHWFNGPKPKFYPGYLNVHHFRWDQQAEAKYRQIPWTRHWDLSGGQVPELEGVFLVDPPFPTSRASIPKLESVSTDKLSEPLQPPVANLDEVIWLVGDGRSGTTWLSELLNYRQNYRYMFEPLHPNNTRFMSLQDYFYLYLRAGLEEEYVEEFEQMFAGKLYAGELKYASIFRHTAPRESYDGLLIKDIFGHLSMAWVAEKFPHVKQILLMRHPFAVARSKIQLKNWHWLQEPSKLLNEQKLYDDFLAPYASLIEASTSPFEKQVLIWSIIHAIVLKQLQPEQVQLVFYEELCVEFPEAMHRLLIGLGQMTQEQDLDQSLILQGAVPSVTTQYFSAINHQQDLISAWRSQLSDEEIGKGNAILEAFGLSEIYNAHQLMPNREAAETLLAKNVDFEHESFK